ncbi:MAG: hypothetical protein IPK59_08410 [Rhodospirillaceae bacterium]|nr:hypothetical protein [Rhodospirillaceae bacterium]
MCPKKIFSSPKVKKADSADQLRAQQAAAETAAQAAERARLASMRGRASLSLQENSGDPDALGTGATITGKLTGK